MRPLIDRLQYDNVNFRFIYESERVLTNVGGTYHPQGTRRENRMGDEVTKALDHAPTEPDRQRIAEDTERFLAKGGQITQVAQGVSGQRQWTLQESVNNEAAAKRERDGR